MFCLIIAHFKENRIHLLLVDTTPDKVLHVHVFVLTQLPVFSSSDTNQKFHLAETKNNLFFTFVFTIFVFFFKC